MTRKLELESDQQYKIHTEPNESHKCCLLRDVHSLKWFPHSKNTKYSRDQMNELKWILDKYPDYHATIQKALHVPYSSFRRLKEEWKWMDNDSTVLKGRMPAMSRLSIGEKEYIAKLLKPPTIPHSILSI